MTPEKRPEIRAAIFDLDGTLLDTLDDLADSMNSALSRRSLPTHPVDAFKYFVGDGVIEFASRALGDNFRDDEKTVREVAADAMLEYRARWKNKTRPYDGVPELLAELKRLKIKTAVLSNKPDDFTKLTAEHFFGAAAFDAVVGAVEGKPRKPDPSGAIALTKRLSVEPAATLFIGDTSTDMAAASAAGMYAVGALWGFRTAGELTANGAKVLVSKPPEVLGLLR